MGIQSQPTDGAEVEKKIGKEIAQAFRKSIPSLEVIKYSLENVIAQVSSNNYNREAVTRGLEGIREEALPIARGKLSALISQIDGLINVVVGKGKEQYQIPKELVGKASEILRIQWDKYLMNLLFEVKNDRYTQGPKSEKLKGLERKVKKKKGGILSALSLFMEEGGASSVDELRNKLKKSWGEVIKALKLVDEASKFF